jgi:hypothetical protein
MNFFLSFQEKRRRLYSIPGTPFGATPPTIAAIYEKSTYLT